MKKIILLCFSLFFIIVFSSCQSNDDTFEARRLAAKQLLTKDCDFISNASTEFIRKKHPVLGTLASAAVSFQCDCITDSLAVQFAKEYDLETITNMQTQPIETAQKALEDILNKNSDAVSGCFGIK